MNKTSCKFWGTRGSCPVSGISFQKYGGNTPCVEFLHDGKRLILDGGTGLRPLGEKMAAEESPQEIQIVLSHMHWDHIMGIPFFEPLYIPGNSVHIWCPQERGQSLNTLFEELFLEEFFPIRMNKIQAALHFHPLPPKQSFELGPFHLQTHPTHHSCHAVCFKVEWGGQEKIGYATDNELFQGHVEGIEALSKSQWEKEKPLLDFFSDCTQLIHEAQYFSDEYKRRVGWGHSSAENAAAFIEKLEVSAWYVVHHDPKHTDHDLEQLEKRTKTFFSEKRVPTRVQWLGDGTVLEFKN